jgi:hypothetical protein
VYEIARTCAHCKYWRKDKRYAFGECGKTAVHTDTLRGGVDGNTTRAKTTANAAITHIRQMRGAVTPVPAVPSALTMRVVLRTKAAHSCAMWKVKPHLQKKRAAATAKLPPTSVWARLRDEVGELPKAT